MIETCTIVTRARLAYARVLAHDVREHHEATLRVLVIDDTDAAGQTDEPFDRVPASQLALGPDELMRLAMLFEPDALATVLTPLLLLARLDAGSGSVAFVAPKTALYAPLDGLASRVAEHGAVVALRRVGPLPNDGQQPGEPELLDVGLVDTNVVAVDARFRDVLDAWTEVLGALDPGDSPTSACLRARGWLDHLVSAGAVHLEDPAVGLSRWNFDERGLAIGDGGPVVAGQPLRSFDFADFDADAPWLLAPVAVGTQPRTLADESSALAALCREYAARVRAARRTSDAGPGRFEQLADGTPIDRRMRSLYRDALFGAASAPGPPNPLVPGGTEAFVAWLRAPTAPDVAPRVGRYLVSLWGESERLRDEYPELDPTTAERFEAWCRDHGDVPACVLPTGREVAERTSRRRRARPRGPRPPGVNVVGYLSAALGLGEVARNLAQALASAGADVAAVTNRATDSRELYEVDTVAPEDAPYDVNLFVVTADTLPALAGKLGPEFFAGRHSIGLWFWEADRFRPGTTARAIPVLDELWAPSAFVRAAVEAAEPRLPVESAPIPVMVPPIPPAIGRGELGLSDDRLVFLFMFDFFSVTERKNPIGLIDSYRRAFAPEDGATLVLKSINGAERIGELEAVRAAAAGRRDIVVWDEYLDPDRHAALLGCCDAYVSLHRSEGLGLTMAEAMGLGKPVIATGFSGNLEFMHDDVAFLVRSTLEPIGPGIDPYPADAHWAEPDLDHAATLMRSIADDRVRAKEVGRRAADLIRSRWSTDAVGPRLAELVEQARARPLDPTGPWREFFTRGWRNRALTRIPLQYRFDWLADGFPLDDSAQRILTYSLRRALELGSRAAPPDLDGPDATVEMVRWLNAPIAPRRRPVVSRYLVQYWHDHPDLQDRFPTIETDRAQAEAYSAWVREHWVTDTDIDWRLVPDS